MSNALPLPGGAQPSPFLEPREAMCALLATAAPSAEEATAGVVHARYIHRWDDDEATRQAVQQLEHHGLAPFEESRPALVTRAGLQFLAAGGQVPRATLGFLPHVLDDVHARAAFADATREVIDDMVHAASEGWLHEHVVETIVPPAFEQAVDERVTAMFLAAASALIARLSDGAPAACVAEEIVAVRLIAVAEARLAKDDDLEPAAVARAQDELRVLFELFEDDDVIELFDMTEPADAAVTGHDPISQQLGVADQRVEAWFAPFWGRPPLGHLQRSQ